MAKGFKLKYNKVEYVNGNAIEKTHKIMPITELNLLVLVQSLLNLKSDIDIHPIALNTMKLLK